MMFDAVVSISIHASFGTLSCGVKCFFQFREEILFDDVVISADVSHIDNHIRIQNYFEPDSLLSNITFSHNASVLVEETTLQMRSAWPLADYDVGGTQIHIYGSNFIYSEF
eukprot:CAMPEP_0196817452 /NCGR_PEP_ID=MMETSP1362-20130617/60823_1 /TAXON_ID=163516 /ORGANISM="Leptocylindrus danicus, Strain CCMP1856" /LENGTH=110 /DNA_ID=CAMNT_0042195147 /DNA_START=66 /DNA_END=395 /DNA_ORIENTATION=+